MSAVGLRAQLIRDEGVVAHAYQDSMNGKCSHCGHSKGFWTIGVGHLIDKRKGGSLPPKVIDALLDHDIAEMSAALYRWFPWSVELDEPRRATLIQMAFQLGIEGLAEFRQSMRYMKRRVHGCFDFVRRFEGRSRADTGAVEAPLRSDQNRSLAMNAHFSSLTIFLLVLGWLTHWFVAVRKARAAARAAKTMEPTLWDYWVADRYTTYLSVIGLLVFYFVMPYLASQWPTVATAIGATAENPMNPIAAYLGGIVSPYLSDIAGKRVSAMVGDTNDGVG